MRPSDWSPLGLAHDPTPGDPVVVRAGGRRYTQVAEAISRAAASLRGLEAGTSNVDSVKALLETRDTIVDGVGKAEGRYRAAGSALGTYATVLDRVQSETANALHAARSAVGEAGDASRLQEKYHQLAQEAEDAGDAEQQDKWAKKEESARADAAHSAGAVSAQKAVVHEAVADRNRAAQTAIDSINQITANDGLNDSWWDDWGAKLTTWIASIAEAIATIAGILALLLCWVPILGQALLIIAAVAGIVAALANILLAATGEKSWGEAAMSVVFAALGCIGVGGALRALGGLAKLGIRGAAGAARTGAREGLAAFAARFRRGGESALTEVTSADRAALADYTGAGYSEINMALRGKSPMTPAIQARADSVSQALSKLPDFAGDVFRGTDLNSETIASYVVGQVKIEQSFVSTSLDAGQAFPGNTLFLVDSAAGKAVTDFSVFPGEAEILFDKGSRFLVTSNQFDATLNKIVITMKELRA